MARTAGRSRGCRTCRQRRIKCDETLPECSQCKKYGKKCPGPITGTFYIITSEAPTWSSNNLTNSPEINQIRKISTSNYHSPYSNNDNEALQPVVHAVSTADTSKPWALDSPVLTGSRDVFIPVIPSCYQPSRAEAFEQLFFSHFFDACGGGIETMGSCSWLSKLPIRMATLFTSLTMKYSARATFMAFYGIPNGDVSIQTEARKNHAKALETRRADICQDAMQQHSSQTPTSKEAICATIIMSYLELAIKTTPLTWMQHLDATVTMLETKGPEGCQFNFIHQLFRTARLGVAFASVVLRKPHVFSQERWKTIPFQRPKKQLDHLVDVMLSIPEFILLADSMIYITSPLDLQKSLQDFRMGLSALISNLDDQIQNIEELPAQIESSPTAFLDPFSGCLAAIRHAAYLICFSLLAPTDTESNGYQDQAVRHSKLVLGAVDYVDTCSHSPASSLFMTTVFSLNVISTWSPSPVHRAYALKKLENSSTGIFSSRVDIKG